MVVPYNQSALKLFRDHKFYRGVYTLIEQVPLDATFESCHWHGAREEWRGDFRVNFDNEGVPYTVTNVRIGEEFYPMNPECYPAEWDCKWEGVRA